ncbi:hypothetical protein AN926_09200 [Thermus scotoductus]|uniref:Uncharacterized protein n=1 Tax=Thermus scotoductus TaxID=37636 RepID=A0A0N0ZQN6_THESC|nr:hypothetical protein AN926_09200 [Thermus scotoductus]
MEGGGDTYRLEVRPERFRLSYASFGLSLQGGCTLGEGTGCQAPFFRLERTGSPPTSWPGKEACSWVEASRGSAWREPFSPPFPFGGATGKPG